MKPVFFTETVNKYTTVLFTVTGIGQVTVTTVKFEKEYITRCMKKGGYDHRRSYSHEEGPLLREQDVHTLDVHTLETAQKHVSDIPPPPGVPYREPFGGGLPPSLEKSNLHYSYPRREAPRGRGSRIRSKSRLNPSVPPRRRRVKKRGPGGKRGSFSGHIGDIRDLYSEDIFYQPRQSRRLLEASVSSENEETLSAAHPPLLNAPIRVRI